MAEPISVTIVVSAPGYEDHTVIIGLTPVEPHPEHGFDDAAIEAMVASSEGESQTVEMPEM
jgi:hypothetical protein